MLRCFDFPISNISGQQHRGETARGREGGPAGCFLGRAWGRDGLGLKWGSAAEIRRGSSEALSREESMAGGPELGSTGKVVGCVQCTELCWRRPTIDPVHGWGTAWGHRCPQGLKEPRYLTSPKEAASAGKEKRPEEEQSLGNTCETPCGRRKMGKKAWAGGVGTGRKTLWGRWHRSWSQAAAWACEVGTERAAHYFGRLTAQDGGSDAATEPQPWCQPSCILDKGERGLTRETLGQQADDRLTLTPI